MRVLLVLARRAPDVVGSPWAFLLAVAALLAVVAGCGGDDDAGRAAAPASSSGGVEKCVDRFLARVDPEVEADAGAEALRAYIEETYCGTFARRGWVYDDGALSIEAHRWLEGGSADECGESTADGTTKTVPCEDDDGVIDCALLHHVRRSEVEAYVAEAARTGEVECDDGTPVDELGVP